ncbi:hypothetical protein RhiirC2_716525 [Rhizophagus irregularis]|uniref:SWIM-type domain-containing protein n=1 Tax=Rhizophagus irregularis TaxID=588596 RepID=A0A2N1MR17_9GLOM|nr:hypothetical protein RhiirC2_716525 [Rhizophagus irregularis]
MDSKHDLNNDRAPILVFVIENNSGSGTPLAFGLSNRENQWTIKLSISAIKKNIPCNQDGCEHKWSYMDLSNGKGFERIRECNSFTWNPLVMIDKHRPSKIAITNVLHGSILCWFHIMQTIGENFNQLNIPWSLRYPLALAFKVIGRNRTEEESKELGLLYHDFVNSLKLSDNIKQKLITDLDRNWLCDEWRISFIDAGRILQNFECVMTTNNFTERLNRTIEANYTGIQTVVHFVERLYGIKLKRENLTENTGQFQFEAGLATLFDMKSIEEQNCPKKLSSDKLRRLNHGRLYFLLGLVEPSNNANYFYIRKSDNSQILESPFNGKFVELDSEAINNLKPLFNKLEKKHFDNVMHREGFYLANILTGECMLCYDFIWNGPFRDVCKHVHAARLFNNANQHDLDKTLFIQQTKESLVSYFKSKERVIFAENKNRLIYEEDTDTAYNEIVRLYHLQGGSIFLPKNNTSERNSDPFRPSELNKHNVSNKGAPPKAVAKPRKLSRILQAKNQTNSHNETLFASSEKRSTKRIRKTIRTAKEKVQTKEEVKKLAHNFTEANFTETQQFLPHYDANRLYYESSNFSTNSNVYFPTNELLIPPPPSISQPLYNSYTYFSASNQQPDPSNAFPTNLQIYEQLSMLNSPSFNTFSSINSISNNNNLPNIKDRNNLP